MATCGAFTAFAAPGDYVPSGENAIYATNVHEGDSVAYYQVVEYITGTGWQITSAFSGVQGLSVAALTDSAGITDALAAAIANAASGSGTAMTADANDTTKFSASPVAPGLYYLKATASDANKDVIYNPAFVSADYTEGGNTVSFTDTIGNTAVLKSSTITFDKDVNDTDKFKDTKPGDIIPYIITTQIPSYGDTFVNPTFSITDTFSEGLKLKIDDTHKITVAYGSSSTNTTNTDVEITGATNGASTFTVAFTNAYLTALAGEMPTVTVTYYGEVTTEALKNVTYMDNTAVLTYSNTPTTTDSKEDITRHYTFTIDGNLLGGNNEITDELIKVGVDSNGKPITNTTTTYHSTPVSPLSGATFSLTPVSPTTMNNPNPRTAVSGNGGHLTFTGLDAGQYTLVETAAPAGFIKDNRTFTVTITPHWNTTIPDLLDSYDIVFSDDDASTSDVTASFTMTNTGETKKTTASAMPTNGIFPKNTRGTELPSTGGMGTTIFYIIGVILLAGAAIVLVTRRRMNAE